MSAATAGEPLYILQSSGFASLYESDICKRLNIMLQVFDILIGRFSVSLFLLFVHAFM